MERRGHYLKPGVRGSAPGILFSIGLTPSVKTIGADEFHQWHEWGGADVVRSRYRKGHWSRDTHYRAETVDELHNWLERAADPRARNYVICPEGQDVPAQVRLWDHIDTGRVKYSEPGHINSIRRDTLADRELTVLRRVALSPHCFILDYTRRGTRWTWLGGRQFFNRPESELATITGEEWATGAQADAPGSTWARSPHQRASLWLHLFQHLSTWWRTHALSPFALTASGLSLGMLRTYIGEKVLCTHTHPKSLPLEREACFGGMARTWYFGDVVAPGGAGSRPAWAPPPSRYGEIEGPIYQIDVASMYPYLLREREYPVKHYSHRIDFTPKDVIRYAETLSLIARVTIETDKAEYPERVGRRIYYRTGRFTTTLTGPEILALREHGKITHCHEASLYLTGRPFREAAAKLISLREAARNEGKPAWEMIVKTIGNGLGGKLAQKRGEWVHRKGKAAVERYGEWYQASAGGRTSTRYRGIAGICWEWRPDPLGAGPFTAAFAHLAAYGRLLMREVRAVCPPRSVLSMDTDGLWCTAAGVEAITAAGFVHPTKVGALRVKDTATFARFLGPRHYCTDAGWVLSGFTSLPTAWNGGTVTDAQRFTAIGARGGTAPRGTSLRVRRSALTVESHGMQVSPYGWGEPTRRPDA